MLNVIVQSSTVDKGPNPRGVEKHLKKTNDISYHMLVCFKTLKIIHLKKTNYIVCFKTLIY